MLTWDGMGWDGLSGLQASAFVHDHRLWALGTAGSPGKVCMRTDGIA